MIDNNLSYITNINNNQNFINNNSIQLEENKSNIFTFPNKEYFKDLNKENDENNDKKSITNQSGISYKDIPVDLDFLSTATSQNGEDIPIKGDINNNLNSINLNQNMIDHEIYKKAIETQSMMKMSNMYGSSGLNNFGNNILNIGFGNNMNNLNYYQFMNYLNLTSQMNNMNLYGNNYVKYLMY